MFFPRRDAMSKTTQNSPTALFTLIDNISTEDLLVNLTETLACAHAPTCDFAFDLEGTQREGAPGIAQLIEVGRLVAERVLDDREPSAEAGPGKI